ncbi:MAG: type VI secretion system baseplate subunit TssK [Treponema sp.]|jgi:type VI secretion system ImpJ/VasE family protein|nr:type VI secretion system baseplate subunit TssK [Treponema sp.]
MRFEQFLHWSDGLFLQPHHFQHLQWLNALHNRLNRYFCLPYTSGFIDFEFDDESLLRGRVVLRRFSVIMPNGLEVSEPGNCKLRALDLNETLKQRPNEITIYLAVPHWSVYEGNIVSETNPNEKKIYVTSERELRDENTGVNEITLITHSINARLITNLDDATDMQILPVARLKISTHDGSTSTITRDDRYIPPFIMLTADCPLLTMGLNLLFDIRRSRDKVLNTLTVARFNPNALSGINTYNVLYLRVLNLYETRLSSLLVPGHISPFDLYIELSSFLAELMGLNPRNGVREIKKYIHDDFSPVFNDIINDIRSFLSAEGGIDYIKLEFKRMDDGMFLFAALKPENIQNIDAIYLAVHTEADDDAVVRALERGDTFRLVSPKAKGLRNRGVRLTEMRYPPRFLPVLSHTLWFKLEIDESPQSFREMCNEGGVLIDYAVDIFPALEATLYITVLERN